MDSSAHNALQGCVSSLRSSMQLLDSSISILDSGVNDYPRLGKVLQTTRVSLIQSCHRSCTVKLIHACDSTSNWSPKTTSPPHNPACSPKSNPKSAPSSRASKPTWTNSSGENNRSSPKQSCRKVACRSLREAAMGRRTPVWV
jgi:hypothetical protein